MVSQNVPLFKDMYEECYLPYLKLMHYEHADRIILVTHAPFDVDIFFNAYWELRYIVGGHGGCKPKIRDQKELTVFVDKFNDRFKEAIGGRNRHFADALKYSKGIQKFIWNRGAVKFPEPIECYNIYGHTGGGNIHADVGKDAVQNGLCLDTDMGKSFQSLDARMLVAKITSDISDGN